MRTPYHQLKSVCKIETRGGAIDAQTGAQVPTWTTLQVSLGGSPETFQLMEGIPCDFQPDSSSESETYRRESGLDTYTLLLPARFGAVRMAVMPGSLDNAAVADIRHTYRVVVEGQGPFELDGAGQNAAGRAVLVRLRAYRKV